MNCTALHCIVLYHTYAEEGGGGGGRVRGPEALGGQAVWAQRADQQVVQAAWLYTHRDRDRDMDEMGISIGMCMGMGACITVGRQSIERNRVKSSPIGSNQASYQ